MRENQANSSTGDLPDLRPRDVPVALQASMDVTKTSTDKHSRRVLIIENEALMAEVLAELLTEMGFTVCGIEATEAGAVATAARTQPQLMIIDANLREGSGISAAQTIIHDEFIPHVFVSGDDLSDHVLDPRAVALQKPFLEAELAQAIRRAIGIIVD